MSDTPRTDDFENWWKVWGNHVSKVFVYARNLECEIYETQEELAEAVTKERERCARVCEEFYSVEGIAQKCAAAIRKGE